jgi:hypothetical protein
MKHLPTLVLSLLCCIPLASAKPLKPFDFAGKQGSPAPQFCAFPELKLPADVAVFAAGAYAGRELPFQIDQSGSQATQIDVAVNSPNRPVVLMLGAYDPTVWNIGWTPGTRILAVLASGYHRQAVAGLQSATPQLVSTHDNKGPCGNFYIGDNNSGLNPLARKLFGKPVDLVFPAAGGKVVVGDAWRPTLKLVTSPETPPESFRDHSAPMAGPAGLQDALRKGLIRAARSTDAAAWKEALDKNRPARDEPPVAGKRPVSAPEHQLHGAYVVLKAFQFPAGLYGAHSAVFYVPKGVPRPTGQPGHSTVYDFNTLACNGSDCGSR